MAQIRAYLTLIGDDFDANLVSKQIGLDADEVRVKDEVLGNGQLFGHTEWGIETRVEDCDEVGPVLQRLFDRVPCSPQILYEVSRRCMAEWHILILLKIYNADAPVIYFPESIIQYAAQIHAQIGFDCYIL